ncbi:ubiquitin-conjugating enzyme E2 Q2-like [Drosophila subobscura]|uniref:ubiquitin-conjugating enzyme E2 Q2-like n=1 Tax=Drosophila subobscura TaxID=7241 RepID=UPI00155A88F9|nr:ubiquitin-conjugating enzyme E2 Q2-like [Drosophila subobscura]
MACLRELKLEIKALEKIFTKTHDRFQTLNSSLDEIEFRFIDESGKRYDIMASIPPDYPTSPPVWYAESEETSVASAVQVLSHTDGPDNHLICQVRILLHELCQLHNVPLPADVVNLKFPVDAPPSEEPFASVEEADSDDVELDYADGENIDQEQETDAKDEDESEMDMLIDADAGDESNEGMKKEDAETLDRLRRQLRKYHMEGSKEYSVQSTDRLMKELRTVYQSDAVKTDHFSVDLVNDSLYEWNVRIKRVDPDSTLHQDLLKLKESGDEGIVLLRINFSDKYPFEPPFVRVVSPVIQHGFVLSGGAICMELLTKQGWSSAYTMEAMIIQIGATLTRGSARAVLDPKLREGRQYNLPQARKNFQYIMKFHEHGGWFTPPKSEG